MRVFKKYLYPVGFAMMLFSSSAMARLPITAYKNVTKVFHKDMEFYSPTLGAVGLWSGLVENIRFYGPFEAAFKPDGSRDYIKDKSSDPLWNMVKIFFPSVAGQLGISAESTTNLARAITSVETIADFIKYAKDVREGAEIKLDKVIENILNKLDIKAKDKREFGKRKSGLKNTTIKPLLQSIQKSIEEEKKGTSLYPDYTTEQVILAFFDDKFNTPEDIRSLLEVLDDSIVDKTKPLPNPEDSLKREDLPLIAAKQDAFDQDDVFNLSQAEVFTSLTPYKQGVSLLNNGNTYFYDRAADQYIKGRTFSDCVEVTGRHIVSLLTFNSIARGFDLTRLEEYFKTQPDNPYKDNFLKFMSMMTLTLVNDGDIGTRSLWNKVLGDLNAFKDDGPMIDYLQDTNELKPGFINLLKAFQKVFGLTFNSFPTQDVQEKETWVKNSLQTLFELLNPNYQYEFMTKLSDTGEDIIGDIVVTVSSLNEKKSLFSFELKAGNIHMQVGKLKMLIEGEEQDYATVLKKHPTTLHDGTAEESVWLLAPTVLQSTNQHLFYKLFTRALSDNDSKIYFLKILKNNYGHWSNFQNNISSIQLMIKNVLSTISWSDDEIIRRVSPIILSMIEVPEFQVPLFESVRGLKIESLNFEEAEQVAKNFRNLESLDFSDNKKITGHISFSYNFKALKRLKFINNDVTNLTGLENLPDLEFLLLSSNNLGELAFTEPLEKLKTLNLNNSGISKITGLKFIPHMKELNLDATPKLTHLSFEAPFNELKVINLWSSAISTFTGVENIPNVELLNIGETRNLKELSFTHRLEQLKVVNLSSSAISKFTGVENIPNVEELNLQLTGNLTDISFTSQLNKLRKLDLSRSGIKVLDLKNTPSLEELDLRGIKLKELSLTKAQGRLKTLDLSYSQVSKIKGLKNTPHLEKLILSDTPALEEVALKGFYENLRTVHLEKSSLSKLTGLQNAPNVEYLDLADTGNLSEITLTSPLKKLKMISCANSGISAFNGLENLPEIEHLDFSGTEKLTHISFTHRLENLKTLDFSMSSIRSTTGFENTPNLTSLQLGWTQDLTELTFTEPLRQLRKIYLLESGIKQLSGLDFLENLKELNLSGCENIKALKFEKDNKDLIINLRRSGIKKFEDIDGNEHLERKNVHF